MENNFQSNQSYDLSDNNTVAVDSNGNNEVYCELSPPSPPPFDNLPNPAPLINELRHLQLSFDYMTNLCGDTFLYLSKIQNSPEPDNDLRDAYNVAIKARLTALQSEFRHFDNVALQAHLILLNAKRALETGLETRPMQHSEADPSITNSIRSPADSAPLRS